MSQMPFVELMQEVQRRVGRYANTVTAEDISDGTLDDAQQHVKAVIEHECKLALNEYPWVRTRARKRTFDTTANQPTYSLQGGPGDGTTEFDPDVVVTDNNIENHDFGEWDSGNNLPEDWEMGSSSDVSNISRVSDSSLDGKRALQFDSLASSFDNRRVDQKELIGVTPGARFQIKGRAKCQNLDTDLDPGDIQVKVAVEWYDGDETQLTTLVVPQLGATFDVEDAWEEEEFYVTAPPDAEWAQVFVAVRRSPDVLSTLQGEVQWDWTVFRQYTVMVNGNRPERVDYKHIQNLRLEQHNRELQRINDRDWYDITVENDSVTGTPDYWRLYGFDDNQDPVIELWPVPDSTFTVQYNYNVRFEGIEDPQEVLPVDDSLVLWGSVATLLDYDDQEAGWAASRYQRTLNRLKKANNSKVDVRYGEDAQVGSNRSNTKRGPRWPANFESGFNA